MKFKRLIIGTFNLYNLNEPGLPIYSDTGGWSRAEYDRKIDWTSRMIRLLHPDIFGFQELWHSASIIRALEASELADEYDLLVPENTDGTRIVCSAIVRKGLIVGEPEWIEEFPDKFILQSSGDDPQTPAISVGIHSFSRPVLHFAIRPHEDHEPVHVYVCHFKSKAPTKVFQEDWFEADEATYKKHATSLGAAVSTIRRTGGARKVCAINLGILDEA